MHGKMFTWRQSLYHYFDLKCCPPPLAGCYLVGYIMRKIPWPWQAILKRYTTPSTRPNHDYYAPLQIRGWWSRYPLDMKECICHFAKWQMHSFISTGQCRCTCSQTADCLTDNTSKIKYVYYHVYYKFNVRRTYQRCNAGTNHPFTSTCADS